MNSPNPPVSTTPAGENGLPREPQTGGALTDAKNAVAQTARDTVSKVKSSASSAIARGKDEVERIAAGKKTEVADRVQHYSSAIHDSAKSLEENDPNIAWMTHRAADKLQNIADYVRERNFSDLRHDAENWARRHPAAFFGGLFLAGLVLGNVVKASRRNVRPESDGDFRSPPADPVRGTPEADSQFAAADRSAAGI